MFRLTMTALFAAFTAMPCNAEFRDPTQPAYPLPSDDTAAAEGIPLILSAIWISPYAKRATINGIIAKQGQIVEIKQTPTLNAETAIPENTAITDRKTDNPSHKTLETLTEGAQLVTDQPTLENNTKQIKNMGDLKASLLPTAIGSMDAPQLQAPNSRQQANTAQRPAIAARTPLPLASMPSAEALQTSARSSTIKIIDIHKNSVTIDQDGERKTLQLVQRPYKAQ